MHVICYLVNFVKHFYPLKIVVQLNQSNLGLDSGVTLFILAFSDQCAQKCVSLWNFLAYALDEKMLLALYTDHCMMFR